MLRPKHSAVAILPLLHSMWALSRLVQGTPAALLLFLADAQYMALAGQPTEDSDADLACGWWPEEHCHVIPEPRSHRAEDKSFREQLEARQDLVNM